MKNQKNTKKTVLKKKSPIKKPASKLGIAHKAIVGRPKKNKSGHIQDPKTGKFLTGRPPAIDEPTLRKLEIAFGYGATDLEACAHAGISLSTLYKHQEENPEFTELKEGLKQRPNLAARKSVVEDLEDNPETGKWWLERRLPGEFGKGAATNVAVQVNFKDSVTKQKEKYGL